MRALDALCALRLLNLARLSRNLTRIAEADRALDEFDFKHGYSRPLHAVEPPLQHGERCRSASQREYRK